MTYKLDKYQIASIYGYDYTLHGNVDNWLKKEKIETEADENFILGMQSGFIECAEWADCPEHDGQTKYQPGNGFTKSAIKKLDKTVKNFYQSNKKLLRAAGLTPEQCGHDFYLTAQGHGTGFWDRGIEEGEALTTACKKYGWDVWANEDGLLEI